MKKRMTMLLLAIAMVFMCFGCTNSSADSLDDTQGNESDEAKEEEGVIGIISAMDNEIALLLKQADIDHVDHIGDMDFHVGELCGKQVVIVKSGIGKVRAAAGIAAMLSWSNMITGRLQMMDSNGTKDMAEITAIIHVIRIW